MTNTLDGSNISWFPCPTATVGVTAAIYHPNLVLGDDLPDWIEVDAIGNAGPVTLELTSTSSTGSNVVYSGTLPTGHPISIAIAVA